MLRLAKAFWDIALWRKSPAQLPASLFLLGLVAGAAALLEVLGALLPPNPSGRILTRVILSVGLPLLFAWVVLVIARRRQRFLQTGIALLGVAVLAQLVLYPVGSLLNFIGIDQADLHPAGRAAVRRSHLVPACLREHMARCARCRGGTRCRDQYRLSVVVDGIGAAIAA